MAAASSSSPFFSLKRLAASLLLAGLPGWAFAELVVDPAGGRETNVISAPNGVPVIEIANPNGKGLSHNRFTEFDVVKPGVIFNNSQANGVSQLGGAILGNPNLQRQATAILSEVTGNKPSSISGTLEVFGGRADILIANPNGLTVNGVTTLNSSSLTLSTGRSQDVNGALQLLVDESSGQVVIGAEGVNTEGLSYFDIVARSVALQGAIGSKAQQTDIQIAAGQGTYDPLTGTFTAKPGAVGSGLAISGSAAGAMYGRYINLISSDSGAGVRHEGLILAAGDIHLSAAGDIELKDAGANGRVDISTTATLTNTGTVAAGKTLTLSAQDLINRKGGYVGTDGDLSIKVLGQLLNEQGATLLATGAIALSAGNGFTNAGGIQSGGTLQLSTDGALSNSGMVRSMGLTVNAGSLSNEQGGVFLSNTDASFTVKGDLTNRSGAGIYAQQKLTFDVTGAVLNDAATLAANSLVISAGSMTNQAAAKVLADAGLDLDIKNAVLNDNAVLAAKTLTVKAASLTNQNAAKLVADQSVTLNVVGAVVNNASTLASGNLLSIKSASLDNASSAILAGTTVTLDAADIRNRDSAKLQGTDVSLTASTRFSNESSASLQASNILTLDTDTLTVTGGELLAGNDLSLTVGTYKNTGLISSLNTASLSFKNNANLVIDAAFKGPQAANLFTLNAHDVTVTGELNSPGSVLIKATGDVRNQGTVIVGKSLGIEAKGLIDNAPGKLIWAGKNLYLDAGTVLTNGRDSLLMAMGDIALSAGQKVQNNTGRIEAQGDLSIDTPLLENLSSAEGGVSEDSQVKSDTRYTDTYRVFELQYYRVQVSLPTYKSTLSVQQGVVKAGGDLLLNQGTSKGKKATVRNVGGLMAATGNVLVDGNLENRGVSASKSLVDILRAAQTEWRWSNSNGFIYPDGDWVQGTLYSFLDEYLAAGAESRWIKSLKKTSTPGLEQVLSAVLGADWKALEQDTLVQRWADFKANGSDKTQPYYADTQAEISAGQTFLQTGGTFENGDGSNWKEQTPITVKVGSKTVDSLAGELDAQFNLTRDGATDLLKQQLGSPLFQKRESSGDGQAFERVKPLYETRVKYLDQSQFLGSQYFLDKIGYDPQKSVTVLGDAYFDHQLIVQSVEQRVGNFYAQTQRLGGTALVKMLLDNGAALAATEGVSFGQPLTAAQVAALTSDVVWYENQVIDGQTVLAPKLYLSQKTLAARAQDAASSALVSADTVLIDADSVTNFNGTVRGNTDTFVYSKGDINNISLGGAQAGFFAGNGEADGKGPAGQLVIAAEGLVRNQGGVMSGFQQTLVGGKGILSSATTGYDETGALVIRDNGQLGMGLTPDVEKPKEDTPAADPVAQTPPAEKQPLKVEAPKVREIFEAKLAEGPVDTSQGSSLSLISGGDITLTSAITQADNVLLQTTGNLNLNDLHEARSAYAASHTQGFLSSVNVEERAASANSVGNVLTAKNLTIQAQKDLNITGGEINAQNSDIRVGGNSKVVAGKDLAFYEKAVTTKQLVIGAGVGAGGYEATGLWGTAPPDNSTLPAPFAKQTVVAGSGSVRGDVNVGRAAASQELAKAGSTGATSGANKGRGGTNGANFKIGYEEVTTTDSTESVNYRNAQLNLGSGSVDVGGSLDIGGADINAGYQLSPEARAKMTPEQRAEASKNMPTLAISAGDIKTTKYEDSETTKHTREEFFAGYTAEAHSSVLDVAGNASNLAHKALGKDVVNDPDAPKGSSKTLANEQKAMEVDPALTALAAAGMATQLAFGEAAGVSSTYGIQHTQEEKETSSRAENINQIGGNISLTSTKGDIELNGVNLQGGKVAIKSAGNLTQRAAKSSTTSSESVQTHTAGLTGSAGVSPTGVGTGISVGASGNYDKTESSSTSYTNGLISGTEVSIETKGDHNLIGSNIKGNQVALKIGGNQTITSVQDTSKTDHTRGNWSTSVGVAITTDGLIVPTASASGSGGKDYDDSKLVAEQAGIDADSLDLNVAGNLDLTGAHIVSKPGQGTVKVDGRITAKTLHDSREKDGGYGGGGGGISKNGLPTATLEGGRVDQVHYQADNTATIDVGDPSKVTAGNGMDGKLNTDASKQLNVTENRRVAGTDVKIEISVSDAKEIKAGVKKAFSPKAPKVHLADAPSSRTPTSEKTIPVDTPKVTPRSYADSDAPAPAIKAKQTFDQHVIVTTDSQNPVVKNAVDNLVAKHPDKSVVVKANADGTITPIQGELKPGTAKYEVVGHGDGQSLGGLDGKQISDVVQKLAKDNNTSIDKLALVGCGTACSKDGKSLVNEVNNRLLEGGNKTQVKGYDGAVAVNEQGRKRPVADGGEGALGKGDPTSSPPSSKQQMAQKEATQQPEFSQTSPKTYELYNDEGPRPPSPSEITPEPSPGRDLYLSFSPADTEYNFGSRPVTPAHEMEFDETPSPPGPSAADHNPPPSPTRESDQKAQPPKWETAGTVSRSAHNLLTETDTNTESGPAKKPRHSEPDSADTDDVMNRPTSYLDDPFSMPMLDQLLSGEYTKEMNTSQEQLPADHPGGSHAQKTGVDTLSPTDPLMGFKPLQNLDDPGSAESTTPATIDLPLANTSTPTLRNITSQDILTWDNMSYAEQAEAGGHLNWLSNNGIKPSGASYIYSKEIGPRGYVKLLKDPSVTEFSPKGEKITDAQIQTWRSLSQKEKDDMGGWQAYAHREKIDYESAYMTLTKTDIRKEVKLSLAKDDGTPITQRQIEKWNNLTPTEKENIGGREGYAKQEGISALSANKMLSDEGIRKKGEIKLKNQEGNPITTEQINEWNGFTQAQRQQAGGWEGYATQQGIQLGSARSMLTDKGLTKLGKTQTSNDGTAVITKEQIETWDKYTPSQRKAVGGWEEYAKQIGINPKSVRHLFTQDGLTERGKARIHSHEGMAITKDQIEQWKNFTKKQKEQAGGWEGYAKTEGISTKSAYETLTNRGLKKRGELRLLKDEGVRITTTQIGEWESFSKEQKKNVGGWRGYAKEKGLNLRSAAEVLTDKGLTKAGKLKQSEEGTPISQAQVEQWNAFTPTEKNEIGGWEGYAKREGINLRKARRKLTDTGLTKQGRLSLASKSGPKTTDKQVEQPIKLDPRQGQTAANWKPGGSSQSATPAIAEEAKPGSSGTWRPRIATMAPSPGNLADLLRLGFPRHLLEPKMPEKSGPKP